MTDLGVLLLRTSIADSIRQQIRENLDYVAEALRIYKFIMERLVERAEEAKWRAIDAAREAPHEHAKEVAKEFYKTYKKALEHNPSDTLDKALALVTRTCGRLFNLAREIDRAETFEEIRKLWRLVRETIEEYTAEDPGVPGLKLSQELLKSLLLLDDMVEEEARTRASHRAPDSRDTRS